MVRRVTNIFLKATSTIQYSETRDECVSLGLDRVLLAEEQVSISPPSPNRDNSPARSRG